MSKKSLFTFSVCVVVGIATTFAAYFLLLDAVFDVKIRWISLLWVLFSEVICLVKILAIRKQTIFTVATISTSFFHVVLAAVCAGIFLAAAPDAINLYIFINIVALAVLIIADVLLIRAGGHVAAVNKAQGEIQATFYEFSSRAERLSKQYQLSEKYSGYSNKIAEVANLLKYSDNTFLTGYEPKLSGLLDELSTLLIADDANEQKIGETISALKALVQERSNQAKALKRGSY